MDESPAKSRLVARAATRFAAVYFTLLWLPWPVSALFVSDRLQRVSDLMVSTVGHAWRPLVDLAASLFHVGHPVAVNFADTGSSDRLFDWLVNFCVLVIAAVASAVWTIVRANDAGRTAAYLRTYLRYTLGAVLLTYGSLKLSQFPPPYFSVLNKAFGEETPMGLLWTFVGASTGYTTFIGLLEMVSGALLLFRRTTLLGACLAFALTLNIFLLNLFYDVPVKLFSFHLMLAALILLGPDLGRLAGMFLLNRPVPARSETPGRKPTALLVLKTLFVMSLFGWEAIAAVEGYVKRTAPKAAIEGIWKAVDSDPRQPARWQWLTIDKVGQTEAWRLWRADGSTAYGLVTGMNWKLSLVGRDELAVTGVIDGAPTSVRLLRNQSWATLGRHPFHWIQDAPREP